ncbi:MAG: 3-hydroxyacyl-ACP dehydratase FabZ [Clostridia bacterium]|nr:3-hydroxyacyl-ACP dehydratase FabZ [Clostridia bacterium]MBN2882886.1 3-hydroxyacyl-ACP dehydratase FabZ [Clostridia bacterium]
MNEKVKGNQEIKISDIVPHRYPFLMIDKILERDAGVYAKCLKNVSANEPFFQGHFPGYPVMPGVMICEAMAQTAGIASGRTHGMSDVGILAGMNNVKFKKPVYPGDTLIMEGFIDSIRMNVIKCKANAYVNEEPVASATFTLVIVPGAFSENSL